MKKKQKFTNSFIIGLFVLTGLALLVGFILWMGATKFLKQYDYYVTYFEESVGGLESGSTVKYLGVPCGFVQSIDIAPDGKLVEIILKIDPHLRVNNSMIAKLEMSGLAGGKYIQLLSADNPPRKLSFGFTPPFHLINSAPSQLDEIAQSAETIISDLKNFKWKEISNGLVGTLDGASKLLNNDDLINIIMNFRETSTSINELIKELNSSTITNNLESTSLSLSKTAAILENFSQNLDTKLSAIDIPKYLELMYTDFNTTLNSVNVAIDALTTKFQSSMLGINILLENLNKTNKNFNRTLRNINESPYMFLTEPPPFEDFNKQK